MEVISENYQKQCQTYSDIFEHIPTLNKYASECETVVECGMRSVVSSWGFANGLLNNNSKNKQLISVDLDYSPNVEGLKQACKQSGINFIFVMADDTKINLEPCDLLFIDTFHVYQHLKTELELHADKVKKYIIMHDTEVDKIYGECIRNNWDAVKISQETGYPVEGIVKGLQPAIDEFLDSHKDEWVVKEIFDNNNGLMILERINTFPKSS